MATDRDEQQRQQQELEEIRRSFAEMGARMGSLFEPTEPGDEPALPSSSSSRPALPAPPAAAPARPRWWWAGALVLLFLAGTAFGRILPEGDGGSDVPPVTQPPPSTAAAKARPPVSTVIKTVKSVPESCVDASELADEIISRLNRNQRDNTLALDLTDYSVASQACRREASS
jgi:hypothetical protein